MTTQKKPKQQLIKPTNISKTKSNKTKALFASHFTPPGQETDHAYLYSSRSQHMAAKGSFDLKFSICCDFRPHIIQIITALAWQTLYQAATQSSHFTTKYLCDQQTNQPTNQSTQQWHQLHYIVCGNVSMYASNATTTWDVITNTMHTYIHPT